MKTLRIVHGPPYVQEGEHLVLCFDWPLFGSRFDVIEYEPPRNGREREYIEHVRCRLNHDGTMGEIIFPAI